MKTNSKSHAKNPEKPTVTEEERAKAKEDIKRLTAELKRFRFLSSVFSEIQQH